MKATSFHFEIADAPAGCRAYWVHTTDEVKLRVAIWKAGSIEKGSILMFPGRTEFIETFGRTITEFRKFGYSSLVIDWRGHGRSDRVASDPQVGHVDRFSDYQKDVAAMVRAAEKLELPKPWYLLGNSMGATIGLRALIEGLPVTACAFCAPMWDINLSKAQRFAAWPVSWAAQLVGRGENYAPGHSGKSYILGVNLQENRRTSDPDMYQYMVNQAQSAPELHTGGPSMGWLFQTLCETRRLSSVPSPDLPCITFCPEQDKLVGVSAAQNRMAHWSGGKFKLIKNARHNLLMEIPEIRGGVISETSALFASALDLAPATSVSST